MKKHRHREKTYQITGYMYPVAVPEKRRAHGGVCIISTCACGAKRKTNSNGRHEEQGPWVEQEQQP